MTLPRSLRPNAVGGGVWLAALALGLGACWGGGDESSAGTESQDTVAVADSLTATTTSATADSLTAGSVATDSAATGPTDSASVALPFPPEAQGLPAQSGQAAPAQAVADRAAMDRLEQRLDQIAQSQSAIVSRLDSLTGRTDTTSAATGAGEVLGQTRDEVRGFGLAVVGAILVIVFFTYLIAALVWVLDALAERSATRRLFFKKLVPITRILLWVFAGYLIVRVIFGVDAQGLVAAAAAIGVAVGFAAQDLLKNLFGGIILVFDQPFQVGDKIKVGETYGEVVSIGLRSTRIVTSDDNLVSVPNAQVVDNQVANANAGQLNCQVVTELFLPGWVDEAAAKKIAFEAAASSKYVYLNKPIVVLVTDEFKETFLTRLKVKAYVLDPRFEFLFQSDVTERARAGFREAGLTGPEFEPLAYGERARRVREASRGPSSSGEHANG